MRRISLPILALSLLVVPAPAARAAGPAEPAPEGPSSFSLGLFGGGHHFASDANLGVARAPEASAGPHGAILYGLRAALGLRSWAGAEVELVGMSTTDRTYDRRATLRAYRLNAVAYLTPGNLRLFALLGAGAIEVASTRALGAAGLVRDRDGEFHVGGGLDYRATERLALRLDVRVVQVPGKPEWSLVSDVEASLGLAVLLGAGSRPAAAVAAAPSAPAGLSEPPAPVASKVAPPAAETAAPFAGAPVEAAAGPLPAPESPVPPAPAETAAPASPEAETPDAAKDPSPEPAKPGEESSPPPVPAVAPPAPPPAVAPPGPAGAALPRAVPSFFVRRTRLPPLKELLARGREIQFDGSSSSKLSVVSLPLIGQLAEAMAKDPSAQVEIVAHTGESGDAIRDLTLSKRRADAVKRALVEREVKPSRLLTIGRGSIEPVAPNLTRGGRKLNERVELRPWVPEKVVR